VSAVTKEWLENRLRGTVIKVTDPRGHSFWLVAEGRTFRDFILRKGTPSYGLNGQRMRHGGARLYWSSATLARWVADGRCRIELAPEVEQEADE
jgi:hypothetical protein